MRHSFMKIWAASATAVALILLGVLIGRSTNITPDTRPKNPTYTSDQQIATGGPAAQDMLADAYQIPRIFDSLPGEWRTTGELTREGYAILFDPVRRELIVEQCQHRGYFDFERNVPIEEGQDFCRAVLLGTIQQISETLAIVTDRNRKFVDVTFALLNAGGRQQLTLAFANHTMKLIPGSKNDLFQAIDRTPEMLSQKAAVFEYQQTQYEKQLKARQQDGEALVPEIPRYTLPEPKDQTIEK